MKKLTFNVVVAHNDNKAIQNFKNALRNMNLIKSDLSYKSENFGYSMKIIARGQNKIIETFWQFASIFNGKIESPVYEKN